jgi:hypothetical protein
MDNPVINIVITDPENTKFVEFNFANEVEIQRSRKILTSTCKIKFPRNMILLKGDINTIMKRGSRVVVKLGYGDQLRTEFTGYIARVSAKIPFEISCEDEMWALKQNSFSKAWKQVKLIDVITYVYPGKTRVAELSLGSFVIKKQSTAKTLESLKKYPLQCYFDTEGVLVADFASSTKTEPIRVGYDFNQNMIENSLEYVTTEDLRIKVHGISKLPNGKTIEIQVGDADGEERTLNYFDMNEKDLKKTVQEEFSQLKQNGYKNSFKTFGIPYAEPGYIAVMFDAEYPERNGSYLIEAVTTSCGVGGFRRQITLERKLA